MNFANMGILSIIHAFLALLLIIELGLTGYRKFIICHLIQETLTKHSRRPIR